MDPIIDVDGFGNGLVTIYAYGKTWRLNVANWTVSNLPYQPPENPMWAKAKREVVLLKDARQGLS